MGILLASAVNLSRRLGLRCGWAPAVASWWYRRLCRILELRIQMFGEPRPGSLLVANHVSWLDIPAVGALGEITFVSKDEVRSWPVLGGFAKAAGTLFIKRGGYQTAAVIAQIRDRIDQGASVLVFPEGTTSDGHRLRRFHPRLLAAVEAGAHRVQPVAVRYGSGTEPDPVAPFVGDDTLAAHLRRVLRHPGIGAQIAFLEPLDPAGLDRRALAGAVRDAIAAQLGLTEVPSR